jgi:hypothetical protein
MTPSVSWNIGRARSNKVIAPGTASLNSDLRCNASKTIAGWCGHVVTVEALCQSFASSRP